eukprot:TCONS_00051648-protein
MFLVVFDGKWDSPGDSEYKRQVDDKLHRKKERSVKTKEIELKHDKRYQRDKHRSKDERSRDTISGDDSRKKHELEQDLKRTHNKEHRKHDNEWEHKQRLSHSDSNEKHSGHDHDHNHSDKKHDIKIKKEPSGWDDEKPRPDQTENKRRQEEDRDRDREKRDRNRHNNRDRDGHDVHRDRNSRDNRDNQNRNDSNRQRHSNREWDRGKRANRREEDDSNFNFGAEGRDESSTNDKKETVSKEEPNYELSGKLTEYTNTYNGVVIKYNEPSEARKPKTKWRLYPFKGDKSLPLLQIHRQSAFLLGRDRKVFRYN